MKTNESTLTSLAQVVHGHKMVNFEDQEVKGHNHTRPKIDLEIKVKKK